MNDILEPLAKQYKAVLQYGVGELSLTIAAEAVRHRFKRSGKPARIFYVSDYDPAGECMPVSMARKLEFFLRKDEPELDVQLFPVVLTPEQMEHYQLPRTPIKDTERRKQAFEARRGKDAAELDALEVHYPGELRAILVKEIERYYDKDLANNIAVARQDIRDKLDEQQEAVYEVFSQELDELREEHEAMKTLLEERMKDFSERRENVWQAIKDALEESLPDISKDDLPIAAYADERDGALYDSNRDYLSQNDVYQAHKGKETYEEEAS